MQTVIGIKFQENSQIEYCILGKYKINPNITVIVETPQGLKFGKVVTPPHQITDKNTPPKNKIKRISTKADYHKHLKNQKDAKKALIQCKKIVRKQNLKMNIVEATYTFDRDKLIFKFTANSRVDFRQLVKTLASIYHVRIELRQIGARDKAKEIGGFGPCGQKLCCARFLKDLDTVSISMAKNQNIALNPAKVNGACGRLMCCLKYEDETYCENRKCMLKIGDQITTKQGKGTITGLDILKQQYKVNINGETIMVDKNGNN